MRSGQLGNLILHQTDGEHHDPTVIVERSDPKQLHRTFQMECEVRYIPTWLRGSNHMVLTYDQRDVEPSMSSCTRTSARDAKDIMGTGWGTMVPLHVRIRGECRANNSGPKEDVGSILSTRARQAFCGRSRNLEWFKIS